LGTSTYAAENGHVRDNLGFMYIRSPSLFVKGNNPEKRADLFSFGSLLYKMFTGEYFFEKEIKEIFPKKGLEGLTKFMRQFEDETVFNGPEYGKILEKKLKGKDIPPEFKSLIDYSISIGFDADGSHLKKRLEETVENYKTSLIKKSAVDDYKKKLRNSIGGWFLGGTAISAFLLGIGWLIYVAPRPDYSKKTDMETRIAIRRIDESGVTLNAEKAYDRPKKIEVVEAYSNLYTLHKRKYGDKTIADKITSLFIETMMEEGRIPGGMDPLNSREIMHRHAVLKRYQAITLNEGIRVLIQHYMIVNEIASNKVDLEDSLVMTLVGANKLRDAWKTSNSLDYNTYVNSKYANGKYIITPHQKTFIDRWLYKIQEEFPDKIKIGSRNSK